MENTYYQEMINAQNALGKANSRIAELTTIKLELEMDVAKMKEEIETLRTQIQEHVNEIVETKCCDGDCDCGY